MEASWPGQHPEEDDTLVSCGGAEDIIGRRGLIRSLLEIVGRDVLVASYLGELMKTKQVEFWQKNLYGYFSQQSQESVNEAIAVLQLRTEQTLDKQLLL